MSVSDWRTGGKRVHKHLGKVCKRCGKIIREKTKSTYDFLCKPCVKVIQRKIATGKIPMMGGKRKIYSPAQMREALRMEYARKLVEGKYK